ncbi:MAG: acyl-CoA dehydrogenase, partial [Kiloniellaceae bacterium]
MTRATAVSDSSSDKAPVLPELLPLCREALAAAQAFRDQARQAVAALVAPEARIDPEGLEREQFAAHGLAWLATYVAALEQMLRWAERLAAGGGLRELERLFLQAAYGEYLQQMTGGIALSQAEIVRPLDMRLDASAVAALRTSAVEALIARGNTGAVRARIAGLLGENLDSQDFG